MSHIHPNISNPSDYIMDNTYLAFNSLQTSVKENMFFPDHLHSSSMDLPSTMLCPITP